MNEKGVSDEQNVKISELKLHPHNEDVFDTMLYSACGDGNFLEEMLYVKM